MCFKGTAKSRTSNTLTLDLATHPAMSDNSHLELPATPTSARRLQNPHITRIQTRSATRAATARAAALTIPLTPPRTVHRYRSNARRDPRRATSETPSTNLPTTSETLEDEERSISDLVKDALTACEAITSVSYIRCLF